MRWTTTELIDSPMSHIWQPFLFAAGLSCHPMSLWYFSIVVTSEEEMVDSTAMNHLVRNQIFIRRLRGKVAVARRDPHWTENSFC